MAGGKRGPVEVGTGIGLAPGRHVAVTGDRRDRIASPEGIEQAPQHMILLPGEGLVVAAFELDPDRPVVAVGAPLPGRLPGVPGPPVASDQLDDFTATADDEMGR